MTNNSPKLTRSSLADCYDWVLFDQGGTLFDPLPGYYSERNQRLAVAELGYAQFAQRPDLTLRFREARDEADAFCLMKKFYTHQQLVTEHLLRGLVALDICELIQLESFQRTKMLPVDLKAVADRYFERQRNAVVNDLRLKVGCHRLLRLLKTSCRLAIVSNNADAYLLPLVARYRLDIFMEATLSSDALGVCKPHPEIFERAFERLGIADRDRSRVLYVGDSARFDVVGALAAQLDVVLVGEPAKGSSAEDLAHPQPTYRVADLKELAELVGPKPATQQASL